MGNRFALGLVILLMVVALACASCSDRTRKNCTRINNQGLAVQNTANLGGGRCG